MTDLCRIPQNLPLGSMLVTRSRLHTYFRGWKKGIAQVDGFPSGFRPNGEWAGDPNGHVHWDVVRIERAKPEDDKDAVWLLSLKVHPRHQRRLRAVVKRLNDGRAVKVKS